MPHKASADDLRFKASFESFEMESADFKHLAHLRVAYVYLCESDVETAHEKMRNALQRFLEAKDSPPEKFHETFTYFWIYSVDRFMKSTPEAACFDAFLPTAEQLLDKMLVFSYYDPQTLMSETARVQCIPPDLQPISEPPKAVNGLIGSLIVGT